jgi:hypothetical protein
MNKIQIKILKTVVFNELQRYCDKKIEKCPCFNEGQVFETTYEKPEGFCDWAWKDIHFDMLNVLITAAMIPVFFALFVVHREIKPASSSMALILFLVAATVFIATNTALSMLQLSGKNYSSKSEAQRIIYAAAGKALLVRGEHGTPGVFIGFFLITFANLYISFVILNARILNKLVGYLGIIGSFSLLIYIFLVTFIPNIKSIALLWDLTDCKALCALQQLIPARYA